MCSLIVSLPTVLGCELDGLVIGGFESAYQRISPILNILRNDANSFALDPVFREKDVHRASLSA